MSRPAQAYEILRQATKNTMDNNLKSDKIALNNKIMSEKEHKMAAKKIMMQNGQIMQNLLKFVEDNIMVKTFGLIPDRDEHRPSPLIIETLTALIKGLQAQSDKQAMYVANDFGRKGEVPTWVKRHQHFYPSSDLDQYQIASLPAQARFSGRHDAYTDDCEIKMEVDDIDMGQLDIQAEPDVRIKMEIVDNDDINIRQSFMTGSTAKLPYKHERLSASIQTNIKGKNHAKVQEDMVTVKEEFQDIEIGLATTDGIEMLGASMATTTYKDDVADLLGVLPEEVLGQGESNNMRYDEDEDDNDKISGWSITPPIKDPTEHVQSEMTEETSIGKRTRGTSVDLESYSQRPTQRPRAQKEDGRSTKSQIEHYRWLKLKDCMMNPCWPQAKLENMPAMCCIIYDLFTACVGMKDDREAKEVMAEVKEMIQGLEKQPPLQILVHVMRAFNKVDKNEIKRLTATAEEWYQTEYVMRGVPLARKIHLYEGELLAEWKENGRTKEGRKEVNEQTV
ncbi:hypothetical protein JVU11DRAFT_11963 [Chiua virens]|nr:hypothetical protein JVU11DRAFT_11963 [Chiua virens]